ncbi:ABC transporter substrate-binding protein [Nocardioides sp. Kera G14]|uniref:ABC transporter substrate-binding protein n=1 Tax=Nocardioides sp. Kera G14 TaxID=2884264 RepID=UPI001D127092|nr:ABC transporter substrate-binding protein [Nocardioides sp. Kera G14]UDY23677.1 ABC transporter substrate-binding protein [Nocardioides sp. Kera G14]
MKHTLRIAAASMAVVGLASLSACGTRASDSDSGSASGSGADSVKTDFGVTKDTITLGVLSDFSVVYGPLAKTVYAGNQIWADQVNKSGGICGRQIKLVAQDQKMDTQLANTEYASMKSNVLGIVQLLGSPVISSLLPQIEADHMPVMANGWSRGYLGTPEVAVAGTPYDLDEINGLQYLVGQGKLTSGDTIGQIYMAGDFGENAAAGAEYAASQLGLKYVGKKVASTATDISAEMAALKAAHVKAILVSTGPKQTAMVATQAPSLGLGELPVLVNAPSYDPSLLSSPAADEVMKNLLVVTSLRPFVGDTDVQKTVDSAFAGVAEGSSPTQHALIGYANGQVLGEAIKAACADGDLTRQSVTEHLRKLSGVDTEVTPTLDLTDPSKPASTQSLILKPSKEDGGLEQVKDFFASDLQQGYKP